MSPAVLVLFASIGLARAGTYDALATPFAATPDQLRAAADAVAKLPTDPPAPPKPKGKDGKDAPPPKKGPAKDEEAEKPATVEVLQAVTVRFDAAGLATTSHHDVWRIERDDTSLRTGTVYWSPWVEKKPDVQARVVTPDGKERRLDPTTLVEQPVATGFQEMYVDTRKLLAPLPGARKGAIVEETSTVEEARPYLAGGANGWIPVWTERVGRVEVTLDAPVGLPLKFEAQNLGKAKESVKEGRRIVTWVVDEPAVLELPPDLAPPEAYAVRYVAWSTAPGWDALAKSYSTLVDEMAVATPDMLAAAQAARAAEPKDDRRAATAMGRWLADRARYVAVELGAAAVVPRSPADVLSRGYGDCKDKATFLVAMLRSVGIPAHVALLRAGDGPDVDPDLPGANLFNHAIVVMDGGAAPVWIDPTVPELPAGVLPDADGSRWALVASGDTRALVKTPDVPAPRIEVEQDVTAKDMGGASIVQTTRIASREGMSLRDEARREGVSSLVDSSSDQAKQSWHARSADVAYDIDLEDLDKPVVETIRAEGAKSMTAAPEAFELQLGPPYTLAAVPSGWQLGQTDEHARQWPVHLRGFDGDGTVKVRGPRGYELAELPKDVHVALGTGEFSWAWSREADGTVVGRSRLRVPRDVPVADVEAFVKAADEAREKAGVKLRFVHPAQRLAEDGKISESLKAWAAAAARPDALVAEKVGYAQALYEAGYAGLARKVVATVPHGPDTDEVHFVLGWDAATRPDQGFGLTRGFDPAPIVSLVRDAISANEDGPGFYDDLLGRMLLYDAHGVFGRGDLDAAVAAWEQADSRYGSMKTVRVGVLLRQGDGARAKDILTFANDDQTRAMRVAAVFLADGLDAAQAEARKFAPDGEKLRALLAAAGQQLVWARQYDAARTLLALVPDSEVAKDVPPGRVRHETYALDGDDPVTVVRHYLLAAGDPAHGDELPALLASGVADEKYGVWYPSVVPFTLDAILDGAMGARETAADGTPAVGYRVRWRTLSGDRPFRYFLVKEKGRLKLRSDGMQFDELGEEAWTRLEANRLAEAQQWLDWALLDPEKPAPANIAGLWSADGDRSADRARLAAAVLMALDTEGTKALPTLRAAWEAGTAPAATGPALYNALVHAGKHEESLAVARKLRERGLDAATAATLEVAALAHLGKADEAEKVARAALTNASDNVTLWTSLVSALSGGGAFDAAVRLGREGVARYPKDSGMLNQVAWPMLFLPQLPPDATELADRIVEGAWVEGRAHTAAYIYAEAGRTEDARKLVKTCIEDHGGDLDGTWALVWGRIAENDGLPDEARAAYKRVVDDEDSAASVYALAQKRLAALK